MRLPSLLLALLSSAWLTSAAMAADAAPAGEQIPATAPRETMPDPADLVPWPEAPYPAFAKGSAADASWLLDAPAGKHGAVSAGPDGRLHFADGAPARFWGTTLCYGMSFVDKAADAAVIADAIAAYGYNLVRFHHNDVNWRHIGYVRNCSAIDLDADDIDRLDRLASELIKRGIYLYVDLLDSRALSADTGLEGWEEMKDNTGWKGLMPHPALVAAWKKAATALLDHVNPYTGRRWADEPAVAAVECINENGPFWDWGFKLSARYRSWWDQQWNAWLTASYKDRDTLAKRWTDGAGQSGLFADEDPAAGTVYRPPLAPLNEWDRPNHSKTRGAARVNDFNRFLAEISSAFYTDAAAHLRGLGFKGVVIGSHQLQGPLDEFTLARSTGALAAHLYTNPLPAWGARPGSKGVAVEGVDVKSWNWFSQLPRIKVAGVPGFNGEWTGGSLMRRADANLAVAAGCAFQRVDGSAHFSLSQRWGAMADHDVLFDWLGYAKSFGETYSSIHDAPWMTINRVCAALFTRGDFAPAKARVDLGFSDEDLAEQNLHALGLNGGAGTIGDAALFLPMLHQVDCRGFATAYDGDADVVFMTGRSASGDYRKAKHAVLVGDNPFRDRWHQQRDLGAPARTVAPGIKTVDVAKPTTFVVGAPWAEPRRLLVERWECAIERASLPAGATPIGLSEDGTLALGWLDDRFLALPNGRAFDEAIHDTRWLLRLYLAAAQRWKIPTGGTSADGGAYISDTGELTVDWAHGTLQIDTPRTQGFSGFVGLRQRNHAAALDCVTTQPYANVVATALDGKPLGDSRRILLVACGRCQNTGEEVTRDPRGGLALVKTGKAPVLVEGLRGTATLRVAADLVVYALDHAGRRLGKVESARAGDATSFALSPRWKTIWYEVCAPDLAGADAPAEAKAAWPGEEKPYDKAPEPPRQIALAEFLRMLDAPPKPASAVAAAGATTRVAIADIGAAQPGQAYGNAKLTRDDEDGSPCVAITYGKFDNQWFGGGFVNAKPVGGDASGLVLTLKGDGTTPREVYVNLKLADGRSYRSINVNKAFENDAWHELTLTPADFTPDGKDAPKTPPSLGQIQQLHLGCVGPLQDNRSVVKLRAVELLVANAPSEIKALPALPKPATLDGPRLALPLVPGVKLEADGDASEAAWQQAVGLTIDEDQVPAWSFTGTHLATGSRSAKERATAWLLATDEGLGVVAVVDKGEDGLVAKQADWWKNDCVELFSDAKDAGDKPTKQLFLAPRRAAADAPAGSDPSIRVGRSLVAHGYLLEAVVPWKALGFDGAPTGEFGLDLQVDIVHAGGGALQLSYATGTNEAYITAKRYLKVTLKK